VAGERHAPTAILRRAAVSRWIQQTSCRWRSRPTPDCCSVLCNHRCGEGTSSGCLQHFSAFQRNSSLSSAITVSRCG